MTTNRYIRAINDDGEKSYLHLGDEGGWRWMKKRSEATPLHEDVSAVLATAVRKFIRVNGWKVGFEYWSRRRQQIASWFASNSRSRSSLITKLRPIIREFKEFKEWWNDYSLRVSGRDHVGVAEHALNASPLSSREKIDLAEAIFR